MPRTDGATSPIGSFHPDGHDFANAEELKHWLLTGEKITKFKKGNADNRPLTERF